MAKSKKGPAGYRPTPAEKKEFQRLDKELQKALKKRDTLDLRIVDLKVRMAMTKTPSADGEPCLGLQLLERVQKAPRKKS